MEPPVIKACPAFPPAVGAIGSITGPRAAGDLRVDTFRRARFSLTFLNLLNPAPQASLIFYRIHSSPPRATLSAVLPTTGSAIMRAAPLLSIDRYESPRWYLFSIRSESTCVVRHVRHCGLARLSPGSADRSSVPLCHAVFSPSCCQPGTAASGPAWRRWSVGRCSPRFTSCCASRGCGFLD